MIAFYFIDDQNWFKISRLLSVSKAKEPSWCDHLNNIVSSCTREWLKKWCQLIVNDCNKKFIDGTTDSVVILWDSHENKARLALKKSLTHLCVCLVAKKNYRQFYDFAAFCETLPTHNRLKIDSFWWRVINNKSIHDDAILLTRYRW